MAPPPPPLLPMCILGTGSVLPGRPVSTAEVCARAYPEKTGEYLEERTGIATRYWHDPQQDSVTSVAAETLRRALEAAGLAATELRRIVLVNSHGCDVFIPATANKVAHALGLSGSCDCFDLNNACAGFITGLDIASRSVATGWGPVAVVATELFSRVIAPENRRPYAVMGDGSGAVVVGPSRGGSGILGCHFGNDGSKGNRVTMDHQREGEPPVTMQFRKGNKDEIERDVLDSVRGSCRKALEHASLPWDQVSWALLHQPNGALFEKMVADLPGLDPSRVVPIARTLGSIASASVPVSLDRLVRAGKVAPGSHLLLSAVGSGLAYGAMVYRSPGATVVG